MRAGAPVTPGRHSRTGSMADAAGSPRVTPRHSRTSSIEALANAASFVQPYKATIVFGALPCPGLLNLERVSYILHGVHKAPHPRWTLSLLSIRSCGAQCAPELRLMAAHLWNHPLGSYMMRRHPQPPQKPAGWGFDICAYWKPPVT